MSDLRITPELWTVGEDHGEYIEVLDCQDLPVAHVFRNANDPPEWATNNAEVIAALPGLLERIRQ